MPDREEKHLDSLPPRVLRFCLGLDHFNYAIKHIPGKELYTTGTLPRAPVPRSKTDDRTSCQDLAELCMMDTISHLPSSNQRRRHTAEHSPKARCVHFSASTAKMDGPARKPLTQWQGHTGKLKVSQQLGIGYYCMVVILWFPKLFRKRPWRSYMKVTRELWDAASKPEQPCGGQVSHSRLLTSSRNVQSVLKTASLTRNLSSLPHFQTIYPWQKVATNLFTLKEVTYIVLQQRSPIQTTTQTRTNIAPPDRLAWEGRCGVKYCSSINIIRLHTCRTRSFHMLIYIWHITLY